MQTAGREKGRHVNPRLKDFTSTGAEWEQEVIQLRVGPRDGDVAQVEAFCRIFRQVEAVQGSVDALVHRMGTRPKKGSKELRLLPWALSRTCARAPLPL